MASHRILHGGAAVAFLVLLQAPASAQGTFAQREACTPDAFRLCMNAMPDPHQVEMCLRASGRRLSQPCYEVFYPPQNDQPQHASRQQRYRDSAPSQMQPSRRQDYYDDDDQ
jgi:hypothetical protein